VSRIVLMASYSITVLNTHGTLIKPTKIGAVTRNDGFPTVVSQRQPEANRSHIQSKRSELIPLEILNGTFVFLRPSVGVECAEISSFARLRIFLAGIQPVLAGFQSSNHEEFLVERGLSNTDVAPSYFETSQHCIEYSQTKWTPRARKTNV